MIAILIDGEYVRKIYKNSGHKLDIFKLIQEILRKIGANQQDLLRVYYYTAPPYKSESPTDEEELRYGNWEKFIKAIESGKINIEIRKGEVRKRGEKYEQKMVDVLMSIDLVYLSSNCRINKIAFVAGDDDYVPAIQRAKDNGVKIYLFYSKENTGSKLQKEADEKILIDEKFKETTQKETDQTKQETESVLKEVSTQEDNLEKAERVENFEECKSLVEKAAEETVEFLERKKARITLEFSSPEQAKKAVELLKEHFGEELRVVS